MLFNVFFHTYSSSRASREQKLQGEKTDKPKKEFAQCAQGLQPVGCPLCKELERRGADITDQPGFAFAQSLTRLDVKPGQSNSEGVCRLMIGVFPWNL